MKHILLAESLAVSPAGLGTAQFGTGLSEADSFAQLDRYTEVGNLIDTAHVYGDWVPGERGRSERIIGKWLADRGGRSRVIISTKGAHPRMDSMNQPRVSPEAIQSDLEESLQRLGTDYIDLYFLHRDDPSRPVGELLECLERQRRAGKIRFYGCSNWRLSRIIEAADYAHSNGLAGFLCNQLMWSLAAVNPTKIWDPTLVWMDAETYAYHCRSGMPAMAYMSIANGYFAHLAKGDLKESVRATYDMPINATIYKQMRKLSDKYQLSMTMLSLLYFSAAPFPAIALTSFSRTEQMEECIRLLQTENVPEIIQEMKGLRPDLTD